jgi:Protein of unknown function (DUF3987)
VGTVHNTDALSNIQTLARVLGGEVSGGQVLAPGPQHSATDRSLSVKLDNNAPDGFLVHSFSADDPILCRDYVREKIGLPAFKPNGHGYQNVSNDVIEQAAMAAAAAQSRNNKAKSRMVNTYDYTDADGKLLYQVVRYDPKDFRQRRPDGNGGWTWKLDERRVLYRWPELLKFPDGTIFVCEGEKDADRVASLGHCATTVAAGKWTDECVRALSGRDCFILQDNDEPGRAKASAAARALHGTTKTIRIVALPDLPDKGDVSDWLDADPRRVEQLADFCIAVPIWTATKSEQVETKSIGSWADPDFSILDDRRGELPDFPIDVFTPPWQELLLRVSHGAGVRTEHVAVPLIGVASSLIGTARRVRVSRSWSEPMTLWCCVVAASGDRKTPGLNVTVRTLDLIEKNNAAATSAKRMSHETRVQKAKETAKKWKEEREAALKADPPREPPVMPMDAIDPGNFIEPRLYATDPTIERLAALLQVRARGMMLIRDELSGLFANMGRYSGGSDRPFWLEAWNGGRHVVERVSGSIVIDHLLVGVIGSFQPDKLARAFGGDEDGMYGRFLFAWPSAPDYRPLSNEAAEVEPELQNALTALIRLPAEDAEGMFAPQAVWLSDDSIAVFEEFRKWIDQAKAGFDGHERQWLVKGETAVLRLAGTLAYMAWAIALGAPSTNGLDVITGSLEPKTIDRQFVIAAIKLWREFFWPHARAALRQIGWSDRHRNARRVLRWIKANGKDEVSREEIRRGALGQKLDAEQTQDLLDGLEKAGWAKKVAIRTPGRSRHRWKANPILFLEQPAESAESAERG